MRLPGILGTHGRHLRPEALYEQADFTYLFQVVFPLLEQAGFTQAELRKLVTDNPQTFFAR